MALGQYIKDTRGELRHVAWPTRSQTMIYTALVAVLSIVVALYLGLFDYLFTTGLARGLQFLPSVNTPSNGLIITPETTSTAPLDVEQTQ